MTSSNSSDFKEQGYVSEPDLTRPFALVLVQSQVSVDTPLGPFGHIGVACRSQEEIDAKVKLAEQEGVLRRATQQSLPPCLVLYGSGPPWHRVK